MYDTRFYEQSIEEILPGYKNSYIKWGSKYMNDMVQMQPLMNKHYFHGQEPIEIADMFLNDLCRNTVIATIAIKLVLTNLLKDWNNACKRNSEKLKYICWIRWHRVFYLIKKMDFGSGAFGIENATFNNISNVVEDITNRNFLIEDNILSSKAYDEIGRLQSKMEQFNLTNKQKELINKQYRGSSWDSDMNKLFSI